MKKVGKARFNNKDGKEGRREGGKSKKRGMNEQGGKPPSFPLVLSLSLRSFFFVFFLGGGVKPSAPPPATAKSCGRWIGHNSRHGLHPELEVKTTPDTWRPAPPLASAFTCGSREAAGGASCGCPSPQRRRRPGRGAGSLKRAVSTPTTFFYFDGGGKRRKAAVGIDVAPYNDLLDPPLVNFAGTGKYLSAPTPRGRRR